MVASAPAATGEVAHATEALVASREIVFGEAMVFIVLLALGFVYAWRKGIFQWR